MPGNNKVFISYAHADSARCLPLLATLDAWGIDYWFDTQELAAGQELSERLQQALQARDVFIRICTAEVQRSFWTLQELLAFRGLQARGGQRRQIIFLMLDPQYVREPLQRGEVVIDATAQTQAASLQELGRVLGVAERRRKLTRRAVLGLGIVAAATIVSTGTAAAVLLRARSQAANAAPTLLPHIHQPTATPYAGESRLRWFFATGGSEVSVAGSSTMLYALGYDGLYALAPHDGSVIWHKAGGIGGIAGTTTEDLPYLSGSVLYVASPGAGNGMYALRASDGTQLWQANLPATTCSSPTVGGGGVYANASDGFLFAYDANTGASRWKTKIGGSENGQSAAAYDGGRVIAGTDQNGLCALDAVTGQIVWQFLAGKEVAPSPEVVKGIVYLCTQDGTVYALNVTDGSQVWTQQPATLGAAAAYSSLLVQDGIVYGGLANGELFALDASTGNRLWQANVPAAAGTIELNPRPAADASSLYLVGYESMTYHLLALDKQSGTVRWQFDPPFGGTGTPTTPVILGDALYFGGSSGAVFAVSLTGS